MRCDVFPVYLTVLDERVAAVCLVSYMPFFIFLRVLPSVLNYPCGIMLLELASYENSTNVPMLAPSSARQRDSVAVSFGGIPVCSRTMPESCSNLLAPMVHLCVGCVLLQP